MSADIPTIDDIILSREALKNLAHDHRVLNGVIDEYQFYWGGKTGDWYRDSHRSIAVRFNERLDLDFMVYLQVGSCFTGLANIRKVVQLVALYTALTSKEQS
jgi:hypothetical protein